MGTPVEQQSVYEEAWHSNDDTIESQLLPIQTGDFSKENTQSFTEPEKDSTGLKTRRRSGGTSLHAAVGNKNVLARALHEKGTDIEAKDDQGASALNLACRCESGRLEIVDLLLAEGADIESEMLNGDRPLHSALNSKNEPLAALLIKAGADTNAHGDKGRTPLHIAAILGLEKTAKILLDSRADIEATDDGTWTPLHLVCGYGSTGVLKLLLEKGADVGYCDEDSWTALHQAVSQNRLLESRLVLEAGADVNIRTTDYWDSTPLQMAAKLGYDNMVEYLITSGADIDAQDQAGLTALHLALLGNNSSVVQTLLRAGADAHFKIADRLVAADLAVRLREHRNEQSVEGKGVDFDQGDLNGLKTIHAAAKLPEHSPDLKAYNENRGVPGVEDERPDELCDVAPVMDFNYDALPTKGHLRLLSVLPREDDVPIKCELVSFRIQTRPSFQALSYRWGNPHASKDILLNGKKFKVGENLWHFLNHQQHTKGSSRRFSPQWMLFWIDAICIDQSNIHERNHQVALMPDIYKAAEKVVVWLGPGSIQDQYAMKLLNSGKFFEVSGTLRHLFSREYWMRTWIVQEFVLAKDIKILCGDGEIDLQSFENFCSMADKGIIAGFRETSPFALWRLRRAKRLPLFELLIQNRNKKCSIIHDKVYALLGLANDCANSSLLEIDYEKPLEQLFCEVMQVSKVGPEYLICFAQFLQRLLGLPDGRPPTFYLRPPNRSLRAGDRTFVDANAWITGYIVHADHFVEGQINTESDFAQYAETLEQKFKYIVTGFIAGPSHVQKSHETCKMIVQLMRKRWYDFRTCSERPVTEARNRCVLWSDLQDPPDQRKKVGFASGDARHGDFLCQFDSIERALVLRRNGCQYSIVGDAYSLAVGHSSERTEYFTREPIQFDTIQPHQCSRFPPVKFRWNAESQLEGYHPREMMSSDILANWPV